MGSILEVPTGAVATVMEPLSTLFTDAWVLIALAIGLPVAFYVIRGLVRLVRLRG